MSADVGVSQIDYHGWNGAWKLTNGTVELVVVPQLGRIMRYCLADGKNVLWENPTMLGKAPLPVSEAKDWQNYGGDKVWPAPQSVWNWPPDPALDPGTWKVRVLPSNRLLVEGAPSEKSGIRFTREIRMAPKGTEVTIVNTMTATGKSEVNWGLWEIAQVDDPELAALPRDASPPYVLMMGEKPTEQVLTVGGNCVFVKRDPKKNGKIGTTSRTAKAHSTKDRVRFIIQALSVSNPEGKYSDSGCRQALYWSPDPDKYVELELMGPVGPLKPGKSFRMTTRWSLQRLP
jgi:hypothetical protein